MNATVMPWNKGRNLDGTFASYTIPANGVVTTPADPIKAAIDDLATVRETIKNLAKREEKLKDILCALAAGDHAGNKCKLVVTESYPERFDGKAFEADHPEVYASYKRKADKPQRTLTIKALV